MKLQSAFLTASFALACSAPAATITAESGLDLSDSPALASQVFTAEDGAVIRVADADGAEPGLSVNKTETVDGLAQVRRLHDPLTGRDWGARTNLVYDTSYTNSTSAGTWVYKGRWYAPQTGLYSFAGIFDDRVGLVIDGRGVLGSEWSTLATAQDVSLAQGWHDVEVVFVNNTASGMGVPGNLPKGLVWSAGNAAFTQETLVDGNLFDDPGDGSRLRARANGAFCRRLDIPSGTATLDLTGSGLAGPFCFGARTGLRTGAGARLLVKGCGDLNFTGVDDGGVHFPLLDADVVFEDNPDGKVHVYGKASIETLRPNYVIEEGCEVAYWGTNMITGAEWTLTNRNAQLICDKAIAADTRVVVAEGCSLTFKPCEHNPSDTWNWRGVAGSFANDFVLAGPNACLGLRDYRALSLTGAISGDGVVWAYDTPSDGPARLTGDLTDFHGIYQVTDNGDLLVEGALPADGVYKVNLGYRNNREGGRVVFAPEGSRTNATELSIGRIWGNFATTYLEAVEMQDITVGTFGGTGGVKTANLTDSHITVESLDANATLVLRWTANVTVKACGAGSKVQAVGNSQYPAQLEFAEGCALPVLEVVDGAVVTLTGTGTVARVEGVGTVVVSSGVTVESAAPGVTLRLPADGVVRDVDPAALASALGSTPALWLDASRADTFQQYYDCAFTNGIVLRRWNDCRPEQAGLYGLNPRGEGYVRVYPYVMTNALYGMDVVSMGAVGGQVASQYGHVNTTTGEPVEALDALQPETRRLPFNQPIRVRTAILVFGSQFGGGGAVLGGDTDQGVKDLRGTESAEWVKPETKCAFARGSSKADKFSNPETPIFAAYRNTWVDGVSVDPTKTGYSGGWQVVSFESATEAGEDVRSLGMVETYANSGGQNYAEVLLYTNALTTAERRAVELYLARKWGLACGSLPLNGAGRLEVASVFPAEGSFAGTVDVAAGGCLDLGAAPAPLTEAEIPSAGRIGWFDPDAASTLELGGDTEPGRENCIYGIFDRSSARVDGVTPYLHGTYNAGGPVGGNGDRRPRAVRSAHGDGPARTWMHFYEDTPDGGGNTLRAKKNHALVRKNNPPEYNENVALPTRTAFIVSDSTYGGGVPVADTVGVNELVRRRNVNTVHDPIWAKGTTATISNGVTRLNGQDVDGFKTGFTGAPEVFSFTATESFPATFFGSCGTGAGERSYELLGEILLYDRVVAGAERDRIEAYLMNKWIGRLPAGWCDWRRATVTGAGAVKAPSKDVLPSFDAAFAGTLDLAGALAFHVDADGVVTDALALPAAATLKLPASGALSVAFADAPKSCVLAQAGAIEGFDAAGWTLQASPETRGRLECADGVLRFVVVPTGTTIFVR